MVPLNVGDDIVDIVLEVKTRGEELMAISETMKILDDDESFRKALPPISFLQAVRETSRNWTHLDTRDADARCLDGCLDGCLWMPWVIPLYSYTIIHHLNLVDVKLLKCQGLPFPGMEMNDLIE